MGYMKAYAMYEEDDGASWEQARTNEERRRLAEDEALERCRILTEQAQAEWEEYEKWSAAWWARNAA